MLQIPIQKILSLINLGNSTSSEEVAKEFHGARIVKAFNTMYYETLWTEGRKSKDDRLVLFVAGDDAPCQRMSYQN